jgi:hypothetical protein
MGYYKNVSNDAYITTEPIMAYNNKTTYEITVWSGGTNHNTGEEDGSPEFFEYNEAAQALEAFKEQRANGYLDAYVTVRKFDKDGEQVEEYGIGMRDCEEPSKLPKYVQKHVCELLEAAELIINN